MPCSQDCNQGKNCQCDRSGDRAVVVISALILIAALAIGYGVYKLIKGNTGSPCAVEVQFNDSKATYIGASL